MNATRALIWKEWRGLRGIRWTGIALGAVLPVAFAIGAERMTRGGGILAGHASWTPQVILMEVLPASLALAIWPLVALLAAAQAFAADRAAGTEAFLLERPVSRGRVFLARLFTAYGSLAAVVAGTALLTFAIAWVAASPGADASRRALLILAGGACGSALVLLCGVGASWIVKSPAVAVLLGVFLLGLPLLLATELSSRFPAARMDFIPLGVVWPALLIPAYLIAGWVGATRGEPMGRGAIRRMSVVLAAGLVAVVAGFFLSAAWAMRRDASVGSLMFDVEMPKSGPAIVIRSSGRSMTDAGWIVDTATGKRLRFLPPSHAFAAGWKTDGSVLAVVTDAGKFGAIADALRMEFYRPDGSPAHPSIAIPDVYSVEAVAWCGDRVAMTAFTSGRQSELFFVDPRSGAVDPTGFRRPLLHLFGPTDDGAVWVSVVRRSSAGAGDKVLPANAEPKAIELYRIDPATRTVGAEPVVSDDRWMTWWFQGRVSRSGRYWVRETVDDRGVAYRSIVDLTSGAVAAEPRPTRNLFWLDDDRVAWTETAGESSVLMLAKAGEAGRPIRAWKNAHLGLLPAPGGRAIVADIRVREGSEPRSAAGDMGDDSVAAIETGVEFTAVPSQAVYLLDEDRWVGAEHIWKAPRGAKVILRWAGPKTFLRTGVDAPTELVAIDRPGEVVRLW